MVLTFKKLKKEGQYRSFQLDHTDIKLDRRNVGQISENRDGSYQVSVMIKREATKERPAPFRWITFQRRFDNEPQARDWVIDRWDAIFSQYDIYQVVD